MTEDKIRNIIEDWFESMFSHVRYTKDDAQTIATGIWTKIEYDDIDYDSLSEFSNHRFTATYAGKYYIHAKLLTEDIAWAAGQAIALAIYKNGTTFTQKYHEIEANITANQQIDCEDILNLSAGDYIEIYFYHNRGSNTNTYNSSKYNVLNINRIP